MRRFLVGLLFALSACRSSVPPHTVGMAPVVDDAGDTLSLAGPARRIVSLIPATTEWLFALGAGERVVGRTRWCDYPAAALDVPNLGDGIAPSLEAILSVHPDLVLLYPSPQNAEAAARLRDLGVGVLQLRTDLLEDMVRQIAILGRVTGLIPGADSALAAFQRDMDALAVSPAPASPSVLLLAWDQPPMVLGRGSFLSELVERAGGRNAFDDLGASSATVSLEAILDRNPDLILTTSEGTPGFASRPEWKVIPAVREGRFLRGVGSEFSRPSPRAPQAIRTLRAGIEAFAGRRGTTAPK